MSLVGRLVLATLMALITPASSASNLRRRSTTAEIDIYGLWDKHASEEHGTSLQVWVSFLRPIFQSMPKNAAGRLDLRGIRYVLNRAFTKRFGWVVRGLAFDYDDGKDYRHAFADTRDDWIRTITQVEFRGEGATLSDLALLAFALEEALYRGVMDRTRESYEQLGLAVDAPLSMKLARAVMFLYFDGILGTEYTTDPELAGNEESVQSAPQEQNVSAREINFRIAGLENEDTKAASYFKLIFKLTTKNEENRMFSFAEMVALAQKLIKHFAHYNDEVCVDLKKELVRRDVGNVGRISLPNFYSISHTPQFKFTEALEYLKVAGIIDESQPQNPKVILLNYLLSSVNCLPTDDKIKFCCRSACNDIFHELETSIAEPSAEPRHIVEVLSRLSKTRPSPSNISSDLLRKLDQVAETNFGRVPLHGRLFAQWLHILFPHECPHPTLPVSETGDASPSPDDWLKRTGKSVEEESKVIEDIVAASVCPVINSSLPVTGPSWCHENSISWNSTEHLPFQQFEPRSRVDGIVGLSLASASLIITLWALFQQLRTLGTGSGASKNMSR